MIEERKCDVCGEEPTMGRFIFVGFDKPIYVCSSCYDKLIKEHGFSMSV